MYFNYLVSFKFSLTIFDLNVLRITSNPFCIKLSFRFYFKLANLVSACFYLIYAITIFLFPNSVQLIVPLNDLLDLVNLFIDFDYSWTFCLLAIIIKLWRG